MSYVSPSFVEQDEAREKAMHAFQAEKARQHRLLYWVGLEEATLVTTFGDFERQEKLDWVTSYSDTCVARLVTAGFSITRQANAWNNKMYNIPLVFFRLDDNTKRYSAEERENLLQQVHEALQLERTEALQCGRPQEARLAEARAEALFEQANAARRAEEKAKEALLEKERVAALIERLDSATILLGGGRVWDGGRLALPSSDMDVFVKGVSPKDCEQLRTVPCAARNVLLPTFVAAKNADYPVSLVATDYHWALTGREARQARVLRGGPFEFHPAPGNAESCAIRRAAMRLMGVQLCAPGPDVGPEHVLRQSDAVENAVRWVAARAAAWSDEGLQALVGRVRTAMGCGRDVREVL